MDREVMPRVTELRSKGASAQPLLLTGMDASNEYVKARREVMGGEKEE